MKKIKRRSKDLTAEQAEEIRVQEFFDRISPSTVKFFTDHYICGNSYKSVWAVREYPTSTEEQAILSHLADRSGVTLRIYNRLVDSSEQRQIIQHAARRNKLMTTVNDVTDSIEAENNLKDMVQLIADLRRNKEPLLHTAVFNILSYMSNQLLGKGNTAAAIDELYLFLTNLTAIEYIRNAMKRVRKKESSIVISSQNVEDFLLPEIKEFTKPLFSIPTHQFYFNPGNIEVQVFIDTLQLEMSEYDLVKYPARGSCLYRCGNERYLLQVIASGYKAKLFGKAGGR